MIQLKNYKDFVNFLGESEIFEGAIEVRDETNIKAIKTIKNSEVLGELQSLLTQRDAGEIARVTVLADVPTQGKNAPQYIKDIFAEYKADEDTEQYSEGGGYEGSSTIDRYGNERTIFIDSEFIVNSVDTEKKSINATPYSLRRKGIEIEIPAKDIWEIGFYKK